MRYIDLICLAWFVWLRCMVITNFTYTHWIIKFTYVTNDIIRVCHSLASIFIVTEGLESGPSVAKVTIALMIRSRQKWSTISSSKLCASKCWPSTFPSGK